MSTPKQIEDAKKKIAEIDTRMQGILARFQAVQNELAQAQMERQRYQSFIDVWYEMNPGVDNLTEEDQNLIERLRPLALADAIGTVLKERGGSEEAMQVADIIGWLRHAGKLSAKAKTASSNVIKTMQRYPERFHNPRRGTWALVRISQPQTIAVPSIPNEPQVSAPAITHRSPTPPPRSSQTELLERIRRRAAERGASAAIADHAGKPAGETSRQ